MAKIPGKPEEIFGDFSHDMKALFGADLVSIILYGSAARGEYVPKKSDINFMVVLTENGINTLGKALDLTAKWHKRKVATPLFLTKNYIASSLDTFPIEFLNFKTAYRLISGEDVLKDFVFDKKFVRLQCERELKGKLLQLRENFLETGGRKQNIEALIRLSLPTFFSIFQAVLFLNDKQPAKGVNDLLSYMANDLQLDTGLFRALNEIKLGRKKLAASEAVPVMEKYIAEIRKLSMFVDRLEVKST